MIKLIENEVVYYQGIEHKLKKVIDLSHAVIQNLKNGSISKVLISELNDKVPEGRPIEDPYDIPLDLIPENKLKRAEKRLQIITSIIEKYRGDKKHVEKVAEIFKVSVATIYRWINKFDLYGLLVHL